jgi:hypothetical protein
MAQSVCCGIEPTPQKQQAYTAKSGCSKHRLVQQLSKSQVKTETKLIKSLRM